MSSSHVVFLSAIVVVGIATHLSRYLLRNEPDPVKKTLKLFRLHLIFMGGFCIVLWFLLPQTPVLSTFGYPKSESDIRSATSLLRYLQEYNRAIVRTTQVLHWFIFVFVWWFMTTLYELTKTLSKKTADPLPE
jgi:hypothetical protein